MTGGTLGIGLVGCGYWGANLVRNVAGLDDARIRAVCDRSRTRLDAVQQRYPTVAVYTDHRALLADPAIDAVIVATPAASHYRIALDVLRSGRHVLVEKPLATFPDHARHLLDEAARLGLTLMVGHTYVYSGAVRRLRRILAGEGLGTLRYYDSTRTNLGVFQPDVNVLWDLAVHDLSIIDHLLAPRPLAVSATGIGHVAGEPENLAYATLFFPGSLIAHLHVSWLAPVKLRRILVGGSQRMAVYDDMEPDGKLRIYDKGIDLSHDSAGVVVISYRENGVETPRLDPAEPLRVQVGHFVDCVRAGAVPRSDGYSGLRVVAILEAATRSLRQQGRCVELPALDEGPAAGSTESDLLPVAPLTTGCSPASESG